MHVIKILLCFSLAVVLNFGEVQTSNILFFHLGATSSHRTSIWPLVEKLANKGHNITYIFPILKKIGSHPKVEEITPSAMVPILARNGGELDINMKLNNTEHLLYEKAFDLCFDLCKAFYDSPEIKEWLNRPNLHYDLLMIDATMGECIYGLLYKFKAKHIFIMPVITPMNWDGFGIVPDSATVTPIIAIGGNPPVPSEMMSLMKRVRSTIEPIIWRLGFELVYLPKIKALIEERLNITDGLPDLREFERNASLVLVNTHFVEDLPIALPPLFVSYSGLWCSRDMIRTRKSLPKDLAQFVEDKNSDGFVYISFGSSVIASTMPVELRNEFFKAFKTFPNLKFLWKWTSEIPNEKPENLWLQSWFPQHDILAHPKVKGFVTQCGRPSTQEALCHGVPLITMPIWGDQDYNADRMEQIGAAINIDIMNVTAEVITDAIKNLVYTDKYKTRMSELSQIFKDRPIDPLDNTLYWTEYVLRQKDTRLLRPLGMNINWFQRRLLDVYLVIAMTLLAIACILLVIIYFFLTILRKFMRVSAVTTAGRRTKSD